MCSGSTTSYRANHSPISARCMCSANLTYALSCTICICYLVHSLIILFPHHTKIPDQVLKPDHSNNLVIIVPCVILCLPSLLVSPFKVLLSVLICFRTCRLLGSLLLTRKHFILCRLMESSKTGIIILDIWILMEDTVYHNGKREKKLNMGIFKLDSNTI